MRTPCGEGSRLAHEVDELLRFADTSRPWQFSLRWEKPPRDRRTLLLGLLLALLMTVVELVGFGLGMRHPLRETHRDSPILVTVIDLAENLPVPGEPEPPAFVPRPSKVLVESPKIRIKPPPLPPAEASDAMSARIGSAGSPARLFNPDGSIALPSAPTAAPTKPSINRKLGAHVGRTSSIVAKIRSIANARVSPGTSKPISRSAMRSPASISSGLASPMARRSHIGSSNAHNAQRRVAIHRDPGNDFSIKACAVTPA